MIIIGAGECGGRAAFALRENGYAGAVTLIGDEPHLPYERPPLSKDIMCDAGIRSPKLAAAHDRFVDQGIECLTGRTVAAIDRAAKSVRLDDGATLPYDKLLLATGAAPRRLPLADGAGDHVHYLRSFDDALRIRRHLTPGKRIAIIGGGFIGLELAASAAKSGAVVTLVEALPRILMRGVPEAVAGHVETRHRAGGVEIVCGTAIARVSGDATAVRVELAGGRTVEADILVVGIGSIPSTALAEAAGLTIDNGIAVDEFLQTSDPDIFAAGDCCSFPLALYDGRRVRLESWRNALEQGALAARNMLGANEPVSAVPWFWSDQFDLSLQIAGLAEGAATSVRRDLPDAFILFHLAGDGRLLAASGIGRGNAVAKDIRLAEMLIARRAKLAPADLASADVKLKALLSA